MWGLQNQFGEITSKRDSASEVVIGFENENYDGYVTVARKGRKTGAYRLWFDEELAFELKSVFVMSYMRSLEADLSNEKLSEVEQAIPFWEFLDIEYDAGNKRFLFRAYYTQYPSFPNLFSRLVGSPSLAKLYDERKGERSNRIYKQDWKTRGELVYELGANNVIYMLMDKENHLCYVGEAKDLVKRLSQPHPSIPHWNAFRYDVLPDLLAPHRVTLERMVIRAFASVLTNKKSVPSLDISKYSLANDKIDK